MTSARYLGLFLTIFLVFMALGSREPPWNDAKRIYNVAESIVWRGAVDVDPPGVAYQGKFYAVNPLLPSAIHLPGAVLEAGVSSLWPKGEEPIRAFACHLGPAALGALVCLLVFLLDDFVAVKRRLALAAAGVVLAAGLAVQALGCLFYWDTFIRISQEARARWLGVPARTGPTVPNLGPCPSCFEEYYAFDWLPAFNPIEGHYWLLRNVARKRTWEQAEADAPWHRYTSLRLDIAASYGHARFDWWYIDWRGPLRPVAKGMFAFLIIATGISGTFWRQGTPRVPPRQQPATS